MKSKETIKTYRNMKLLELKKEIEKQNKEYALLKLEVSGKKIKNYSLISRHKKNISRLLTIKNEIQKTATWQASWFRYAWIRIIFWEIRHKG